MQVDDDAWVRLRQDYETTAAPLKEIAARFGVSVQRVVARARKEGWPPRGSGAAGLPKAIAAAAAAPVAQRRPKRSGSLPSRSTQRALIGRLFRAISLKLEHMETRMASGEIRSAQDEERESRALATLITNFEKVTEAVAELDKDREPQRAARAVGADAERMRREIAERLERLGGLGPAQHRPRKPRS